MVFDGRAGPPAHPAARERLAATARSLFARRGLAGVGIGGVIAGAGVVRRSLCDPLASKADSAPAACEGEAAVRRTGIAEAQAECADPLGRLLALLDAAVELAGRDGFRGRALIARAVETAVPDDPLHHDDRIGGRDARGGAVAATDGRVRAPTEPLRALRDGGVVGASARGSPEPIGVARAAAEPLLAR